MLCWGDARIGNVLYRDFEPVGVLDWEMAAGRPARDGPRLAGVRAPGLRVHRRRRWSCPACPTSCARTTCESTYAELTGVEVGDLGWFQLYDAVQWGIVFMRTGARQVRFGEIEQPDDVESLMHHRPLFEQLLDEAGA